MNMQSSGSDFPNKRAAGRIQALAPASARIASAVVFLYVLFQCSITLLQPVRTDDTFWHLKMGRIILERGSLPERDPLLFTATESCPPLHHEWLFQVLLHALERTGGFYALRGVLFLEGMLIFFLLWKLMGRFGLGPFSRVFGISVFALFSYQRLIQLRPHVTSIILFLLLGLLVFRDDTRLKPGNAALAILLGILWANVHSLCLLFFPFWALWLIVLSRSGKKRPQGVSLARQTVVFLLSLAALSLNPMGTRIYYFYLIGASRNPYGHVIDEWGHFNPFGMRDFLPLSSNYLVLALAAIILSVFWIARRHFRLHGEHGTANGNVSRTFLLFASIAALALMLFAVRFAWLVFFPVSLILAHVEHAFNGPRGARLRFYTGLCLGIAALGHFSLPSTEIYRFPLDDADLVGKYLAWGHDRIKYHAAAADFLVKRAVEGKVFNPYYLGGYLSFRAHPRIRVFIDGRFEHYPHRVNRHYHEIRSTAPGFESLVRDYAIDAFFLPKTVEWETLARALHQRGWLLVFDNFQTRIFLRRGV